MANIFKKDAAGKTVLSKAFNKTKEAGAFLAAEVSSDFVDMAKGNESDFVHLSGDKPLQRAFGLVTAPIVIPLLCIVAVPVSLCKGIEEGMEKHAKDMKSFKKDNKFNIM